METKTKKGPPKRGYVKTTVLMPPDLAEWAKLQPAGMAHIIRECLEQRRMEAEKKLLQPSSNT